MTKQCLFKMIKRIVTCMNTRQNCDAQTPELCDTKNGDLCDIENCELEYEVISQEKIH